MKYFLSSTIATLALACVLPSARAQTPDCDDDCLAGIARQYMQDVVKQDYSRLPWADTVRFTENNVAMMIGDGFWGAGPGIRGDGFIVPDAATGNVVWFGITEEHGQAAYHGLRLKVSSGAISEVESYFGREGTPDLFAPVDDYALDALFGSPLDDDEQRPRERMIAIVDGYYNTKQLNDGELFTDFTDDCVRITNGVNVTHGEHWTAQVAQGCKAQFESGIYKPVDRIRARRYPVVNEATGVVVALAIEDHATRYVDYSSSDGQALKVDVEYPNSRGMLELFRIRNGEIERIEGISVFLPYYIQSLWRD